MYRNDFKLLHKNTGKNRISIESDWGRFVWLGVFQALIHTRAFLLLQVSHVLESSQDSLRDRGWGWQMGTTGHESVLVSVVVHTVPDAIITDVLVEALGTERFAVGVAVLDASGLRHLGVLLGQVTVVVAIIVVLLDLFLDAIEAAAGAGRGRRLDLGGLLGWGDNGGHDLLASAGTGSSSSSSETVSYSGTLAGTW